MDSFFEYIVKRNKKQGDYLMMLCIIFGGLILCAFVLMYIGLQTIGYWIIVAIIYGMYRMITNRNIEYEYTVTNGELDVAKIIAKRKRIEITTVHSKDFEYFAKAEDSLHKSVFEGQVEKRIYVYSGKVTEDTCFAIYYADNIKTMLIFDPTDAMIEDFRQYAPKSLFFV